MESTLFIAAMAGCALIPMYVGARLMLRGKTGLAMTLFCVLSGVFAFLAYAATTPMGIDPLRAMSLAMIFFLPAVLGISAGILLGWLIYRRRNPRV